MEITYNETELVNYLQAAFNKDSKNPVLIDQYMLGKEIEVDAISDGENILIPGIMEHLEKAGIHSGDSISIYPPITISEDITNQIIETTAKIAKELSIKGIINIQFVEYEGQLYIIEVNPRSSRTVPFVSKVTHVPMVKLAVKAMMGQKLKNMGYGVGLYRSINKMIVKVPVFSSQKISGIEVSLGPEMKSTGEVLGVGNTFNEALFKGFLSAGIKFPDKSKFILVTLKPEDKSRFIPIARRLTAKGYRLASTPGTHKSLEEQGIVSEMVNKIGEDNNILQMIQSGKVSIVLNTPTKANDSRRDGFIIRRKAVENGVDLFTSLDTVDALLSVIELGIDEKNIKVFESQEVFE
jgi:carbamoyl-phosphate synthase large subunit